MTNVMNPNDTIKIPAKEPIHIPAQEAMEFTLPLYFKDDDTLVKIISKHDCIIIKKNSVVHSIEVTTYGTSNNFYYCEFISHPRKYQIITAQEFNEAFALAVNVISNANYGATNNLSDPGEDEGDEEDDERYDVKDCDSELMNNSYSENDC